MERSYSRSTNTVDDNDAATDDLPMQDAAEAEAPDLDLEGGVEILANGTLSSASCPSTPPIVPDISLAAAQAAARSMEAQEAEEEVEVARRPPPRKRSRRRAKVDDAADYDFEDAGESDEGDGEEEFDGRDDDDFKYLPKSRRKSWYGFGTFRTQLLHMTAHTMTLILTHLHLSISLFLFFFSLSLSHSS